MNIKKVITPSNYMNKNNYILKIYKNNLNFIIYCYLKKLYKKYNKLKKTISIIIFIIVFICTKLPLLYEIQFSKTNLVCLCVIAKLENKYIREFVQYYKKYDIDKIFLYDNNDINGENFEDIIPDFIENGFVELINFRGLKAPQLKAYNKCYENNNNLFDWLIFFDLDEFLYLKDFQSIKIYLGDKRFNKCGKVQFNWVFHTDNNLVYYDNRSLAERFPEREKKSKGKKRGGKEWIKTILRGHNPNITINNAHSLFKRLISCNGFGKKMRYYKNYALISDYEYYYIDHYYCKSTEEFIEKIQKNDVLSKEDVRKRKIKKYFQYNKITKEKIEFIENTTNLVLSMYRAKIS